MGFKFIRFKIQIQIDSSLLYLIRLIFIRFQIFSDLLLRFRLILC